MQLSQGERARYLEVMRDSLAQFVEPEVSSQKARDVARLVGDLLDQLAFEARDADELSARYLRETTDSIGRAREVLATRPTTQVTQRRLTGLLDRIGTEPRSAELVQEARELIGAAAVDLYGARGTSPVAGTVLSSLLESERRLHEAVSARHLATHTQKAAAARPTTSDQGATLDPAAITGYLRRRFPELPGLTVTEVLPLAGGRSKETLLLRVEGGEPRFPGEVVMRRDMAVSLNEGSVVEEFAILDAIHRSGGVPVAEPYLVEADPTQLDSPFMLVEMMAGEKVGDFFPEVQTPLGDLRALGEQEARILAALHRMDPAALAGTGIDPAPDVRRRLLDRIEQVRNRAATLGPDSPPSMALELACTWLLDHLDDGLRGPVTVLHTDIGLHNQLVSAGEVTAVVDWELATVGQAAQDLGYCRLVLGHLMPWDEFVGIYTASGGSPEACHPRAVAFHRLLSAAAGVSYTKLARHIFRSGASNDLTIGHAGYLPNHFGERALSEALLDALAAA